MKAAIGNNFGFLTCLYLTKKLFFKSSHLTPERNSAMIVRFMFWAWCTFISAISCKIYKFLLKFINSAIYCTIYDFAPLYYTFCNFVAEFLKYCRIACIKRFLKNDVKLGLFTLSSKYTLDCAYSIFRKFRILNHNESDRRKISSVQKYHYDLKHRVL